VKAYLSVVRKSAKKSNRQKKTGNKKVLTRFRKSAHWLEARQRMFQSILAVSLVLGTASMMLFAYSSAGMMTRCFEFVSTFMFLLTGIFVLIQHLAAIKMMKPFEEGDHSKAKELSEIFEFMEFIDPIIMIFFITGITVFVATVVVMPI
jgi:hypothetical protein